MAATPLSYCLDAAIAPILGSSTKKVRSRPLPLPADLRAALDAFAATAGNVGLAAAAGDLSTAYRDRRSSAAAIRTATDVAAYLATRMPATYAALEAAFRQFGRSARGFAPRSLLDLGCGPGTASWAAVETFESLRAITMVDGNEALLTAARDLAAAAASPALRDATRLAADLTAPRPATFDLVILSYALTELADADVAAAVDSAWSCCSGALLIVEPGTSRDYARLVGMRTQLLASGARIAAPCPHEARCPLAAPDWCHFNTRLARSREHVRLKGGTLGYEDEKFCYLAAVRPTVRLAPMAARVLARPRETKFDLTLKLCRADGSMREHQVMKREKDIHRMARRLDWGDAADF